MIYKISKKYSDVVGALFTISIGLLSLFEASNYSLGTINNMGPGYFPVALSWLLIILGVMLFISNLLRKNGSEITPLPNIFSIFLIGGGVLSFSFLIESHGIIPAIFSAVFISTFASCNINIIRSLIVSVVTSMVCALVFIVILGLPIKVFTL